MTAQAEDTVVSWRGGFGSRVPAQLKAVSSVVGCTLPPSEPQDPIKEVA
jgi:hypothetical protein